MQKKKLLMFKMSETCKVGLVVKSMYCPSRVHGLESQYPSYVAYKHMYFISKELDCSGFSGPQYSHTQTKIHTYI